MSVPNAYIPTESDSFNVFRGGFGGSTTKFVVSDAHCRNDCGSEFMENGENFTRELGISLVRSSNKQCEGGTSKLMVLCAELPPGRKHPK